LKSYEIKRFGRSGSGVVVLGCHHSAVYTTTSPLLMGTRFPDQSTQSHNVAPEYVVDEDEILLNFKPETLLVPLSRVNLLVGLVVPIPTFVPLSNN
jgi:cysteine sulfinate desulfinase/cysteine desulfurase-like protein